MQDEGSAVTGGVDTHSERHVAAVVDGVGRILDTRSFPATRSGYEQLLEWMGSFGALARVGVEGTGAYGAGLARYLASKDIQVVEVDRPNRQIHRRRGKSDTTDAEAAARAALNGEAGGVPKAADGPVEALRALRVARRSAIKARTQATNQIRDLVVTAPDELRDRLRDLDTDRRVAACARLRAGQLTTPTEAIKAALRSLARRCEDLTAEIAQLDECIASLAAEANPALIGAFGVGPEVASALLVAAGDNPERMRSEANLGGNREANHALWRVVMVRLSHGHGPTVDYVERRRKEAKSDREIIRCLKRFVAREVYGLITNPPQVPSGSDLRARRKAAGLSLQVVADALGTWATRISELERGRTHNTELATRYGLWLTQTTAREAA